MVTTVYDMIYARFRGVIGGEAESVVNEQREAVLKADRVVCISQSTQDDLIELIPEAAGKTTVIYLGSSFPVNGTIDQGGIFESPQFLFVGGRGWYKNFSFLLRAFANAKNIAPEIRLTVAGAPFSPEERWQLHFLGISDVVTSAVYPDEAALQELYQQSVALLYPSRYEGFGIPPLEAMACGTIAVTGNTSSLPEVVGDGGIMLDPSDENAWTDCIIKLARPFGERARLLERGRKRVEQSTWEKCVSRHLEIYRELAG